MLHLRNGVIKLMVADGEVVIAYSVHDTHDSLAVGKTADRVALCKIATGDEGDIRCALAFGIALTCHACITLNGTVDIVLVEDNDRLGAVTGNQQSR